MNKKFIVMAAFAAVFGMSFTACSNSDEIVGEAKGSVPVVNLPTRVAFSTWLDGGAATSGYNAAVGDIQTDGMAVWAFDATKQAAISSASDFFMGGPTAGLEHTWDGENNYFKAAADYFWPEYNLNFVALTPQTGGGIGTIGISQAAADATDPENIVYSKPVMTVDVDVPLTTEADGVYGTDTQKDIMFASIEDQTPISDGSSAALTFKHALSQLVFKGGVDGQSTIHKAVVKSIKLVNVASDGTITYNAADNGISAVVNALGAGQTKTYAANIVNSEVTASINNADPADDETPNAISGNDNNNTVSPVEPGDPGVRDYQMMILPQTSVTCSDAGITENLSQITAPTTGTYLLVNADLYANGNNANKVLSSDTNVYIPLESTTWAPNTKYIYTLMFGDNLLHPITFTASIMDWTTANKSVEF